MKKISIIGAGMVGAAAARDIAAMDIVDKVILLDIKEGLAEGKAIDISQAGHILGYNTEVIGVTGNYEATKGSDVVVVTSGIPRKPGMTREELVGVNSKIVTTVMTQAKQYSPDAIFIIVSNPMDTMVLAALKADGKFTPGKVYTKTFGMGGVLDSSRFSYYIQKALEDKEIYVDNDDISCYVIGGHGDTTMIPVSENAYVRYNGIQAPLSSFLNEQEINQVVENTKKGGSTLTGLLGTSAWEAPGAGIAVMVKSIIKDELKWFPCSVYLPANDTCIGMRAQIGENGIADVDIKTDTSVGYTEQFFNSIEAIKKVNEAL